jgi:hypothetical protein
VRKILPALLALNLAAGIGIAVNRSGDHPGTNVYTWPPGTFERLTGPTSCIRAMHSAVRGMPAPPVATLLKPMRFDHHWQLLPVLDASQAVISRIRAWRVAHARKETLAQYRLFLARVTDDAGDHNKLTWVLLENGLAGPSWRWPMRLPHMPINALPACRINPTEIITVDARTGQRGLSGGFPGNPFGPQYASSWRL